jgi:hypothetical protein
MKKPVIYPFWDWNMRMKISNMKLQLCLDLFLSSVEWRYVFPQLTNINDCKHGKVSKIFSSYKMITLENMIIGSC